MNVTLLMLTARFLTALVVVHLELDAAVPDYGISIHKVIEVDDLAQMLLLFSCQKKISSTM